MTPGNGTLLRLRRLTFQPSSPSTCPSSPPLGSGLLRTAQGGGEPVLCGYLSRGASSRRRRRRAATTRVSSPRPSWSRPSKSRAVSSSTTGRQRRAREKTACSFVSVAPLLSAQRLEQDTW